MLNKLPELLRWMAEEEGDTSIARAYKTAARLLEIALEEEKNAMPTENPGRHEKKI